MRVVSKGLPALTFAISLTIALLVGCHVRAPAPWSRGGGGPRLDHAAHLDRGMECEDCHAPDSEGEPGSPTLASCQGCHAEIDKPLASDRRVAAVFFTPDGSPRWRRAIRAYESEVIFTHRGHRKGTSCRSCHENVVSGLLRMQGELFTMDGCVNCHARQGAPNTCASCHRELRKDLAPASHHFLWKQRHGRIVRCGGHKAEARCAMCHDEPAYCERCHQDEPPRSHTTLFRTRTHGVLASMDRHSCAVCHRTDFCQRCHEDTPPRSHRASFASGRSTHCVQCHFPISSSPSCPVCHRENPRHDTAPPQPPSHVPGLICRNCHNAVGGGGARPLRHVDNGMSCESCHP